MAELQSKAATLPREIDGWFIRNGFEIEELRNGDGCSLEELDYGNDITDKFCDRIESGDIVRDNEGKVYLVEFTMSGFFLKYSSYGYHELVPLRNFWHAHGPIIEVIGNIHDNPELLKESEGSENG